MRRRIAVTCVLLCVTYFLGLLVIPPAAVGFFGNDVSIIAVARHIEIPLYRPLLNLPVIGNSYAWWTMKICKSTPTCTYPYTPPQFKGSHIQGYASAHVTRRGQV